VAVAWAMLLVDLFIGTGGLISAASGAVLIVTVFAAVYHAELIAHRTGEGFGEIILAIAVTIIEVIFIMAVMSEAPAEKTALARDTVFAAVMIACNGIVGLCLLCGGARGYEQPVQVFGATAALTVLVAITTLTLILPNVVASAPGPLFSTSQLIFVGVVSLVLYTAFVFIQTAQHHDYSLPLAADAAETPVSQHSAVTTLTSALLLVVALVAIGGLAKALTPIIQRGIGLLNIPQRVVGIVIAALVLLPQGLTAVRAARANRLPTSLHLALASALATIGLTIPMMAAVTIALRQQLALGLDEKDQMLLGLTFFVSLITVVTGRTTVLQGLIHLVIFSVFLFFAAVP